MKCWFWNVDSSQTNYFSKELEAGRLRQGWGYDSRLDLRRIKVKLDTEQQLDDEERTAWARCQAMLTPIAPDDLVLVKNVPSRDSFTLVRISGSYDYRVDAELGDYGHLLPIDNRMVFHKLSRLVPMPLVNALNREQNPVRVTDRHHDAVVKLSTEGDEEAARTPEMFKGKLLAWRASLIAQLRGLMRERLNPGDTERLVRELLRRDGLKFTWTAGPTEAGADFTATVEPGWVEPVKLAIQVKMHWEMDNDTDGIDQLEKAFGHHRVGAGVLVTTAPSLGEDLKRRIDEAKKRYPINVLYGDDLYQRILELIADPEHEVEEAS